MGASLITLTLIAAGCSSSKTKLTYAGTGSQATITAANQTEEKKTEAAPFEITMALKDGYILFSNSYFDGRSLETSPDKTISVSKNGDEQKYTYKEHILSCGSHINGYISEKIDGENTFLKGDLDVSNNPYKIQKVTFDFEQETNNPDNATGTFYIDGKKVDVNWINQ